MLVWLFYTYSGSNLWFFRYRVNFSWIRQWIISLEKFYRWKIKITIHETQNAKKKLKYLFIKICTLWRCTWISSWIRILFSFDSWKRNVNIWFLRSKYFWNWLSKKRKSSSYIVRKIGACYNIFAGWYCWLNRSRRRGRRFKSQRRKRNRRVRNSENEIEG